MSVRTVRPAPLPADPLSDRAREGVDVPDLPHADGAIYRSARLAAGYASCRPPLHAHVLQLVARRLQLDPATPLRRALDVGCGAGLSTAALQPFARQTVGVDPALPMLAAGRGVAAGAACAAAQAEALPFLSGTFDLITAAGALNYADRRRALTDIARILSPSGTLVIYDFSAGRRLRGAPDLTRWWDEFERRHPYPAGYAMDAPSLDYGRAGLRLRAHETFTAWLRFDLNAYVGYVLSETNVERAVAGGVPQAGLAAWCRATLQPVFHDATREVAFDGYAAYVERIALEEQT